MFGFKNKQGNFIKVFLLRIGAPRLLQAVGVAVLSFTHHAIHSGIISHLCFQMN